jgi:alkylation response protein AidB-like acyl-CoA dehydrogenase
MPQLNERFRPTKTRDGLLSASRNTLVDAARQLALVIRRSVDEGERERRLPAPVAKALSEAGFFRLCRPRELGGLEVDPLTAIDVIEELARHDGSTAWCALNCSIAGVLEAFLPEQGAREMQTEPGRVANGVVAPRGRALEVEGGYRVSGRWTFVSNCHHCDWLAPASIVFKGDAMSVGPMGPELVVPWLKATDCRIIDTWHVCGLRGTGSHDVEISEVFVPKHRCFPLPLPAPVQAGTLFKFPIFALFAVGMAAAALGIARAAIDELTGVAKQKTPLGMDSTLSTRATAQIAVCEAEAAVRSGRALLVQSTSRVWEALQAGTTVSAQDRALLRLAATNATLESARATDLMYTTGGGTALYSSSSLQRRFRDVHAITQHVFISPPTQEMIGRILLGVDPDAALL